MNCRYAPSTAAALNRDAAELVRVLDVAARNMTDHYDVPDCCMSCPPWTRLQPVALGEPTVINGAGWSTRNTLRCPTCAREYLLALDLTPTHNPGSKAASVDRQPPTRRSA